MVTQDVIHVILNAEIMSLEITKFQQSDWRSELVHLCLSDAA